MYKLIYKPPLIYKGVGTSVTCPKAIFLKMLIKEKKLIATFGAICWKTNSCT